jgi:hypothetical protein
MKWNSRAVPFSFKEKEDAQKDKDSLIWCSDLSGRFWVYMEIAVKQFIDKGPWQRVCQIFTKENSISSENMLYRPSLRKAIYN